MLVVFGSINVDFVFSLPHLPRKGETVWSDSGRAEPGGKGACQAVAAARDGASVVLAGAVGQDALADGALASLKRAGVNLRHVARVPASTGRAAVLVDPEGYTMVATDTGANRHASADQVPDALLGPDTTLLLQMETEPGEGAALIERARSPGAGIILNLSPSRVIDSEALRAVDLLIGNSSELAWAGEHLGTGNNPASLHALLGVAVVRMMGAQGAEAMSSDGFLHMPALPVAVRDTTGAADCFTGMLASALARRADLQRALRRAAVAAALSTMRVGAQGSMPEAADTEAALKSAPHPTREQAEVSD
jgi:ribokinase